MDKYLKVLDEWLLYAMVAEFFLFGSVWTMFEVSGKSYLILYWGAVLLGLMKLAVQKNTWKEWIVIGLLGILAVLSWKGSDDKTPLLLFLGVCCSKNLNLGRLIKVDLIVRIFSAISLIVFPTLGLAINHVHLYEGYRYRDYFGWEAANGMGFAFLVICMEWMYLRHRKFCWYDYIGMAAIIVFLDRTANPRFAELLILAILTVELFETLYLRFHWSWERCRLWLAGCLLALALGVIGPVIGAVLFVLYGDDFMILGGTLTARFQIAGAFYGAHGLTLFGSPYNPEIYDYLDMMFAFLGLHLGLLVGITVLALMIGAAAYAYARRDERLLLFLMFIYGRGILESEHMKMVYAFFPVLLGLSIWELEKERNYVKE